MGKRKTHKAQSNASIAKWTSETEMALLSWLDLSVKHPQIDFQTTVVDHLGHVFSLQQIERKLSWFWHKFGPNEIPGKPKIVSDIKTHGTLHLGISENERGQIRFNIEGLERSYDISWSPRKPRLRSTSRLETTVSPQASSWITPPAQRLKTAQKRKRQIESVSIAPSEVKSETKEDTTLPSKKVNLRKRPKTYSKRDNRRLRATACSPESPVTPLNSLPLPDTEDRRSITLVRDSKDDVSVTADEQHGVLDLSDLRETSSPLTPLVTESSGSIADGNNDEDHNSDVSSRIDRASDGLLDGEDKLDGCNQCGARQFVKTLCQQCLEAAAQQTAAESATRQIKAQADISTETDEQIEPRLQSAISKIEELQNCLLDKTFQLQESDQRTKELDDDITRMKMVRKERDKWHGSDIERQMDKQQIQIKDLEDDLKASRRVGSFAKLPSLSHFHIATFDIREEFQDMNHDVGQVFRNLDLENFSFIPQLHQDQGLLRLAQKAFGSGSNDVLQFVKRELAELDHVVVLRALTTVALQEWVFESDFPQFKDDSSLTLGLYREMLSTQDGALVVRNLDLAVFETKIKHSEFKTKILPQEAQRSAIRLSQTLAPFFTCNPQDPRAMSWDGFATWGHATEIWKERQEHFVDIFIKALTTKAKSRLNIEDYEMVLYSPGTDFDPLTMDVETMEGAESVNQSEGRVVRVCVQAAVFAYTRGTLSDDAPVSESIVPAENFVRRKGGQRRVAPRIRAVVVLADAVETETRNMTKVGGFFP